MIDEYLPFSYEETIPIISAISASIITIFANFLREKYKQSKQKDSIEMILMQKREQESNRNFYSEISLIVEANASYRDEIRKDMENLKKEMNSLTLHYELKMDNMKAEYEKEIEELKNKILEMEKMLNEYRRQNEVLHKVLTEENIQIPDWAKSVLWQNK